MKTLRFAVVSAVVFGPAAVAAAAETLGVVAVAQHPGPSRQLVDLTRQLRLAVAERTEGVLEASELSQRMMGQTSRASLTELDRAYAGALATYQAGDFEGAVRMLRGIVEDLETQLNGPEAFDQWTRAMMRLARSLQTIGRNDEARAVLERLVRSAPELRVDPQQYPPGFEKQVSEARARLRALPTCNLTVRATAKGARVFVDGREVGTAPIGVALTPGRYRVSGSVGSLRLPGTMVELTEAGKTMTIDFDVPRGFLPSLGPGLALPPGNWERRLLTAGAYLGVDRLVVAGLAAQKGVEFLVGAHFDVRKGALLRKGRVRLSDHTAPAGSLTALASFLVTGEQSPLVAEDAATQEIVFKDPIGDDDGPGTYVYPTHPAFKPGSFDLTELKVTQVGDRVTFAVSVNSDLENPWDMPAGFSVQMVFIHIKTGKGGFTRGLPGTHVVFSPEDAWNKVVVLSPQPARRVEARAKEKAGDLFAGIVVPRRTRGAGRVISATVAKKDLGDGDIVRWGYQVIMQSNDLFPQGDDLLSRRVNRIAGPHRFGGGTDSGCDPQVIDVLAGKGAGTPNEVQEQHQLLSHACRSGSAGTMATLKMIRK